MNKLIFWFRKKFGFSSRETAGFLVLLVVLLIALVAPVLLERGAPAYDAAADKQLLDSLVAQLEEQAARKPAAATVAAERFPFNPNTVTAAEWERLGLPPYLAKRILNYRGKGGSFRYKTDLQKIYGFPDSLFRQLHPYILLPEKGGTAVSEGRTPGTSEPAVRMPFPERKASRLSAFDLNLADTVQLKRIRGIGSKLSARIVNYRNRLGGFHDAAQVREVFGLPPEAADSLLAYAFVENNYEPVKIKVNVATVEELKAHPYISPSLARSIVAYREQHGPYKSHQDLRKLKLMNEDLLLKLQPYLAF